MRLAHIEVELRVLLAENWQEWRQDVRRNRWNDAKLDGGSERLVRLASIVRDVPHFSQNASTAAGDLASGLRQACAFGPPLDELHAKIPLHLLDLHGQRRLRHGAVLGRLAEVAEAGNRIEIAQLFDRDHCDQILLSAC